MPAYGERADNFSHVAMHYPASDRRRELTLVDQRERSRGGGGGGGGTKEQETDNVETRDVATGMPSSARRISARILLGNQGKRGGLWCSRDADGAIGSSSCIFLRLSFARTVCTRVTRFLLSTCFEASASDFP